ncbi:MAG: radical SAM protein [Candidatus Aenigmatarchaeota archaeon]
MEEISSLLKWKKEGKGYPTQVQIHLTNYCNLRCIFCPTRALVKEVERKKELTKEQWLKIIEEGNKLGVKEWHICGGGEPLFFTKDAIEVMEYIKETRRCGEIITNGTFFQEDVARKVVEIGWDKIYISLDSPVAKTQNYLRQANCFRKIIEGVKNLVKWKGRLKKKIPQIYFHVVICNKNYKQTPGMIKLAKKLKIDGVLLNALNVWKPEVNKLRLNEREKEEFKKILKISEELAKKLKISTNAQDFSKFLFIEKANVMNEAMVEEVGKTDDPFTSIACYYPWYNISIFADGKALPCFILKDEGENVKNKSLKEIWFGEYFTEIRQMFLENRLKEDCSKCNPWNLPKMEEIRNKLQTLK